MLATLCGEDMAGRITGCKWRLAAGRVYQITPVSGLCASPPEFDDVIVNRTVKNVLGAFGVEDITGKPARVIRYERRPVTRGREFIPMPTHYFILRYELLIIEIAGYSPGTSMCFDLCQ
jgi:hypothetical protein